MVLVLLRCILNKKQWLCLLLLVVLNALIYVKKKKNQILNIFFKILG